MFRISAKYFKTLANLQATLEPNPGRRGYRSKHHYASHGVHFDVKTDEKAEFQTRPAIQYAVKKIFFLN